MPRRYQEENIKDRKLIIFHNKGKRGLRVIGCYGLFMVAGVGVLWMVRLIAKDSPGIDRVLIWLGLAIVVPALVAGSIAYYHYRKTEFWDITVNENGIHSSMCERFIPWQEIQHFIAHDKGISLSSGPLFIHASADNTKDYETLRQFIFRKMEENCGKGRHAWKGCVCGFCGLTRHEIVNGVCVRCGKPVGDVEND